MVKDFGDSGSWPGRDWPGPGEAHSGMGRSDALGGGFARNVSPRIDQTPKQMHKLMTIWRQYLKATPVPGKAEMTEILIGALKNVPQASANARTWIAASRENQVSPNCRSKACLFSRVTICHGV